MRCSVHMFLSSGFETDDPLTLLPLHLPGSVVVDPHVAPASEPRAEVVELHANLLPFNRMETRVREQKRDRQKAAQTSVLVAAALDGELGEGSGRKESIRGQDINEDTHVCEKLSKEWLCLSPSTRLPKRQVSLAGSCRPKI